MKWKKACDSSKTADSRALRILLRMPNWLGDAVMASAAFEILKAHFVNAKFSIIGTEASCGIYSRDLRVERVWVDRTKNAYVDSMESSDFRAESAESRGDSNDSNVDSTPAKNRAKKSRLRATMDFAREIRQSGAFDIAVNFTNSFFPALLIYLTGAKIRVGYARNMRGMLLNKKVKFIKGAHQVVLYANLANALVGEKLVDSRDFLESADSSADSRKNVAESLIDSMPLKLINRAVGGFKSGDRICIGINPGAAYGSAKRWEEPYFVEVVAHFLDENCEVFLFGTDAIRLPENLARNPHLHNLIGATNLAQLVDYIAMMDAFISNDSGPMHIAAALKVPLVAIFGSTDMRETSPWCKNAALLNKHLPCAPCKKRECPLKHHNCMKLITPDEVIESVQNILR